jgi:hypothetical protein
MKVEYRKYSIVIIPENEADEVYLETVLGLNSIEDTAIVRRISPINMEHAWAYAELKKTNTIETKP